MDRLRQARRYQLLPNSWRDRDDDAIAKRVRMCAAEFPHVSVLERIAKTV